MDAALRALPIFAAIAFTPLIMRLITYIFPSNDLPSFKDIGERRSRNGWINVGSCLISFAGLVSPFFLFGHDLNAIGWPALGFGFGAMVVFPCLWSAVVTLPFGLTRYLEFWHYYEQKYRINAIGVVVISTPFALVGIASAFELVRRGIW